MFFTSLSDLPTIATRTSCSIFVVPPSTRPPLKNALYLEPDPDKKTLTISVESMRDFLALTGSRETTDRFFIITPADAMTPAAANAFLKTLEEPGDFCHFVLLTENPAALLPTILSRAQLFVLRRNHPLDAAPTANKKTLELAKQLISATRTDLPALANTIAAKKPQPRQVALDATATAIELLYKSYFKTGNIRLLSKLPNFLTLYDALQNNGHIKLHIVSDLC